MNSPFTLRLFYFNPCFCAFSLRRPRIPLESPQSSVADPGFSRGGAPTLKSAIIFQIFCQNCMKMKEFGPPGEGARPWRPP